MRIFIQSLFLFLIASASKLSYASEWSGSAGLEFRGFNQTAKDTQQDHNTNFSFVFESEYFHEWDDGDQSIAFVPYFRVDENDDERTHFDIRELTYLKVAEDWELRIGIRKVFWGVTEFQHLLSRKKFSRNKR